jgi:hypothetical protein
MVVQGFVARISEKSGNGQRGPWTAYSARIEKADGTEYPHWFQFGFTRPDLKDGDYVRFDAVEKDAKTATADPKSIKHGKNPPARAPKAEAPRSGGKSWGGGGYKPQGPREGKGINDRTNPVDSARIAYQNARMASVEVVRLLIEAKALPLSKADTKAGEAKRFDEVMAAVNKLTVQLYNDMGEPSAANFRLLAEVADGGDVEGSSKPAALPQAAEAQDDEDDFDSADAAAGDDEDDDFE